MKYLLTVLIYFSWFQMYAQTAKKADFPQKVFYSDFSEADKSLWPLKNNQVYFLFIDQGNYLVKCLTDDKKAYLFPKWTNTLTDFRVSATVKINRTKAGQSTIGIAIDMQDKQQGGFIVEINEKKEYRVCTVEGSAHKYLTKGKKDGWLPAKGLNKTGKDNTIDITQKDGRIKILFNGQPVPGFSCKGINTGNAGFYISNGLNASITYFGVYGAAGALSMDSSLAKKAIIAKPKDSSAASIAEPKTTDSAKITPNNPEEASSSDINTLAASIADCRKSNKDLMAKYESMRLQLNESEQEKDKLQGFIKNNLDVKLQKENEETKEQNEKLKHSNDSLVQENTDLKSFKKNIATAKDGDVITVLSENLTKEKAKNEELLAKIKKLQADGASAAKKPKPKPKPKPAQPAAIAPGN